MPTTPLEIDPQRSEHRFEIANDLERIDPLIKFLLDDLSRFGVTDKNLIYGIRTALEEAISNAMVHGNLEVDRAVRDEGVTPYLQAIQQRASTPPYRDRRVFVTARIDRQQVEYVVRDQGRGFDPSTVPALSGKVAPEATSGRGLGLIRSYLDHLSFNAVGNELTMRKRFEAGD